MARGVAVTVALALAACSTVPTAPTEQAKSFTGPATKATVGSRMVDDVRTTVRLDPMTRQSRVEGVRAQFVYKGLVTSGGPGKNVIHVRYEEHRIVDGVETETPDYLADIQLDLGQGRVIKMKGWQIGVVDATDAFIEFVAVWNPPPP